MAKKSLAGRKTKLTREVVKKLEEAFAIDATVEEACFYADISRETFYQWIKHNKALADRFEELRQRPVLTARQTVVSAIKIDPKIAMKYLERKRKSEFSTKIEIDNTNKEIYDEKSKIINDVLSEIRNAKKDGNNGVQNREGADVETSPTGNDRIREGSDKAVS